MANEVKATQDQRSNTNIVIFHLKNSSFNVKIQPTRPVSPANPLNRTINKSNYETQSNLRKLN